jgi:hypothetical protein
MMFIGIIRFWMRGWIKTQYIDPIFHFKYWGLEWIVPLAGNGMYYIFMLMGICSLCIMLGLFYRIAIVLFFLSFTYVELIDVTYYLNHYYFVSIISFLMIWLPAGNYLSLDVLINPSKKIEMVPRWMVGSIRLQLGLVYFFAGIAKLNEDWLINALPMKIWLPAKSHLPIIGDLMYEKWVAYVFSWFGAIYDIFIPFFLIWAKTRRVAYVMVIIFHVATAIFFPAIGMFPFIMIVSSLIFFSGTFHDRLHNLLFRAKNTHRSLMPQFNRYQKALTFLLFVYFFLQLSIPFRYLAYPGNLFWTEEGYRFSWRVMLMEKAGHATFYVEDQTTNKKYEVNNKEFLTMQQEKMMSTQPDLILAYSQYLSLKYKERGIQNPKVYGQSYVTLNGRRSAPFINDKIDLAKESNGFQQHRWLLPAPSLK